MIGDWSWGTIWTPQNYRRAMADSACYNMFVEAILQRLAVIATWSFGGFWKYEWKLGDWMSEGPNSTFTGFAYGFYSGQFSRGGSGRDWYKGMGETMMRKGTAWGWPFLQSVVANIAQYFVRSLDENGNPFDLDGYPIMPMVGNFGPKKPIYDRYGQLVRYKYKFQFPYPNGFTRKYSRFIDRTDATGQPGDIARLITTQPPFPSKDEPKWNDWGMNGWYFRREGLKWKHDPQIADADILEDVGLIEKCDIPGPWILNELRDAINQLWWTYANGDFQFRIDPARRYELHFYGYDKVKVRSDSAMMNDVVRTTDSGPNDTIPQNRFEVYTAFFPTIWGPYWEFSRSPGIFPAETYRSGAIATSGGVITTTSPGDPTGRLQESWPQSSYFNFNGQFRSGNIKFDPLWSTPKSEGIPRVIEFFSQAYPFHEECRRVGVSPVGTSWNSNYNSSIGFSSPSRGTLGVVKWDFKHSKKNKYATWNGFNDAFLS